MNNIIRGLSYNRACEYLEKIGIITEEKVEIKHYSRGDLTGFFMNGRIVARYIEKYGKLEYRA